MKIAITIAAILVFLFAFFLYRKKKKDSEGNKPENQANIIVPRNRKINFKMMTYQEALEASKQFIYNITKAVMQRFTPDSQETLLELGKKLVKNGVTYLHVVDVAALSAEKEKQLSHLQQQRDSSKTQQRS